MLHIALHSASAFLLLAPCALAQSTTRESVDGRGFELETGSNHPGISRDGRHVLFTTNAPGVVAGDTNGADDLFVRNRATGVVRRASVAPNGIEGSEGSRFGALSGNGRWVAFQTKSPEFAGEADLDEDIFRSDLLTGALELVSVGLGGGPGAGDCSFASISDDGSRVVFSSHANDLVVGDTNQVYDVFVRDFVAGTTVRVSLSSSGAQLATGTHRCSISGNGRYVAFESAASNVVPGLPAGSFQQVYVRDLVAGTTELVSQMPGGAISPGTHWMHQERAMSSDGRYVAVFGDDGAGAWSVRLRDRVTATTHAIVSGSQLFAWPQVSDDGNVVMYGAGNTAWVLDRASGITSPATITSSGAPGYAFEPTLSGDGFQVAYSTSSKSMVFGDTSSANDVLVRDLDIPSQPRIVRYCYSKSNSDGCLPWISAAGRASLSGETLLLVTATRLISDANGMLIWSTAANAVPFQGGTLCVAPPIRRTPMQSSGGGGAPCAGRYSFAIDAGFLAANALPLGAFVHAQYWQRDAGSAIPIGLSDALRAPVQP